MKKKLTNDLQTVNGYYINDFINGFMGEHEEGKKMLSKMGLPENIVPFSVAAFLHFKKITWKDCNGNRATIWVKFRPNQMECFGSYLRKQKSHRVFLEWDMEEDIEKIARLESEAMGELCMRCIYDNLKFN